MNNQPERKGTLGVDENGAFRLQFRRRFTYSVEEVWAWIVNAEKRQRWLPGCEIEPEVGGKVRFDFGDEGSATGVVLQLNPPGHTADLEHSWKWPGLPDSVVRWTLTSTEEGTELVLVHSEVVADPAVDFAIGWHLMLDALGLGISGESPDLAWEHMDTVSSWYQQ